MALWHTIATRIVLGVGCVVCSSTQLLTYSVTAARPHNVAASRPRDMAPDQRVFTRVTRTPVADTTVRTVRLHATPTWTGVASRRAGFVSAHRPLLDHVAVMSQTVAFARGACVTYYPLRGDRRHTVFIDAGHGGPDPGAVGTTRAGKAVVEKDLALATTRALLPVLRNDGYPVVMARTGDTGVVRLSPSDLSNGVLTLAGKHRDRVARLVCANAAGADVLVALHFNAFADPRAGGAETLYDTARPFRADNQRLADLVHAGIITSLRAAGWTVPNRGVIDDAAGGTPAATAQAAAYGHLLELGPAAPGWNPQPSAMPGVFCEPLFVTNPLEAEIAASTAGQEAIARGMAHAIDAFFAVAPGAS